jgi:hypothetical protein
VAQREGTASRLLRSTAARSYDPELDIDWTAPAGPGKGFMLEHRCSLFGTPLWQQLSPQQRLELGKHEAASVASTGIWLEFSLMRVLAKLAYRGDPVSRHVQYALAELAEECRHSTMLARMIWWMGTPRYGPPERRQQVADRLNPAPPAWRWYIGIDTAGHPAAGTRLHGDHAGLARTCRGPGTLTRTGDTRSPVSLPSASME